MKQGDAGRSFVGLIGSEVRPDEFTFDTVLNGLAEPERSAGLEGSANTLRYSGNLVPQRSISMEFFAECVWEVWSR